MGKTSSEVKRRYNKKAYEQIFLLVPKGRKETIQEYARQHGVSVNGMINDFLMSTLGISEEEWKIKITVPEDNTENENL